MEHLDPLERRAVAAIDRGALERTLDYLSGIDRTSGTTGEYAAVAWLCARLDEYGIPYTVHEFDGYLSFPVRASLRVLAPEAREIRAKTRAFGASTPPQGLEGDLVFVDSAVHGIGFQATENQFDGVDVAGKVVLSPRGGPDGVYDAMRAGAIAHIHIWPSGEDAIHEMISTTVWGTPTPEDAARIPTIPSLSVNHESGEYLRALCARGGPVRVRLTAQTDTRWCRMRMPVAEIRGGERAEEFMLVAGHLDSWYVGTTDNATGDAALLELARLCRDLAGRGELRRSVRIAWWTGHSTGRYSGSTWYCDQFWQELHDRCVGYIDIDSPGTRGSTWYDQITAMMDGWHLAADVIGAVTGTPPGRERPPRAGDYSFYGPGLPALYMLLGNVEPSARYDVGGCGMNWWWHTEYDTRETADLDVLVQDVAIYIVTILRIVNARVLPWRLAPPVAEMAEAVAEYRSRVGSRFDLGPVAARLQALRELAEQADAAARQAPPGTEDRVNASIMAAQRALIPINYAAASEHDHDPAVHQPVLPLLARALDLLPLEPGSDAERFLLTRLVRSRNRVLWSLGRAEAAMRRLVDAARAGGIAPA
jgi:N-acetylated-alpha-linked acidic dipeptidase